MIPIDKVYDELNFVSDRISTQVRTICLGVLAIVWLFLGGSKDQPALRLSASPRALLAIAGLCILALFADYLQYYFAYLSAGAARRNTETAGREFADYDYDNWRWRWRLYCFWLKQVATGLSAVWLLALIGLAMG